ncbi:MFS general substrate transporter [Mycena albidolilacea]|uniref:MFS general substrate transporter n=1 Tax=Mycena albidolilacea TaxID=1033008 RepID=A0AAD7AFU2_9AGAR|nr:MFS general substrate transporter [Mycena albidolilacea]
MSLEKESLERKTSTQDRNSVVESGAETVEFTRDEELKLLKKFDFFILPPLALMYLCNALDKGNVGNAKTDHWDTDIHLKGNQYYLLVMIFYVSVLFVSIQAYSSKPCKVPFCLFGTPISLFVKRFSAARVLPIMMIGFGSMALLAGAAKNFSQIFAIRFFLGIFESPMLPAVVYYLSTFYKRNELASRVGVFYAAASIAGAFSGLIAYGVFHIKNSKYHAWQYLFWIEGAGTVFFAILAWFWLPRAPATWSFLTPRQKEIARSRILADSSVEIDEKVNIADAFAPFKSGLYWIWILISLSLGVPLASVNNFLPQIIAGFHYSTVKTNLYTVAPNILGTVALLLLTFSSDYFRERSIRECIPLATGITGFLILRFINVLEHLHVAYFACFLITMGAFAPSVLVATWYSNNTNQESRRAVVAAVMVAFANSAGLISTNVFRAQDEPRYIPALATSAAFGGFCFILVAGTGIWMRYENAKRNRAQGVKLSAQDVDTSTLRDGPSNPSFRYMY